MTTARYRSPTIGEGGEEVKTALQMRHDRILRLHEVRDRIPLGRSTIYDWMAKGRFPGTVSLGSRLVGWRESEIEDWLAARERRQHQR